MEVNNFDMQLNETNGHEIKKASLWTTPSWSQTPWALWDSSVENSTSAISSQEKGKEGKGGDGLTDCPRKLPVRRSSRFIIMRSQSSSECRIG